MSDSIYDSKMKKNPYAAWGWDYDGGFGDIDSDIDMKGHGIVNMRDPVNDSDAATKQYVDAAIAAGPGGGGTITAQNVSLNTPAGMAATTAQAGFDELADRVAFKDTPNTFTEAQTIGNAVISEVPAAVPYAATYASPTGKVTQISTQNSLNIETPELTVNGDYLPSAMVKYTPKQGSAIQGNTVQQAIDATDTLISGIKTDYVAKTGLDADLSAHNNAITDLKDGANDGDAVNFSQLKEKADAATVTALQTQVTTNTQDIADIKSGTTKTLAVNVTYTAPATGPLTGKSQVQESLDAVNTILTTTATDIADLKQADTTFLTKVGGVLGSDLDAATTFTVKQLKEPVDKQDAATRNYVDEQIKIIQGALSGQLQWAGTYDCTLSQIVSLSDAGTAAQIFQKQQNLPQPSAAIKNYYFIVVNKTPATGNPPAPAKALSAGDWIIGDTAQWDAIEMAKAVTAANVSFTPTGALTGTDVQAALTQVEASLTDTKNKLDALTGGANKLPAANVSYAAKQGGVITGATVQEALTNADNILDGTRTQANTNKTAIEAINNQIPGFAKLGSDNTFTAGNIFNTVPQTTGDPQLDADLITVKKVNDKIAAIKAVGVSYDPQNSGLAVNDVQAALDKVSNASNIAYTPPAGMTSDKVGPALDELHTRIQTIVAKSVASQDVTMSKQLPNLTGSNVQEALTKADELIGNVSDYVVDNSTFVGTYDATANLVLEAFGLASKGQVQANTALPVADDKNKSFFLIVKTPGTGTGNAPLVPLASGDYIRSTGTAWEKVDSSSVKTAADISLAPITNLQATNVQEAVKALFDKHTNLTATDVTYVPTQTGSITGGTVQAALESVEVTQTNQALNITQLQTSIQNLAASQVSFNNGTSNLPGTNINTVQKAIDAVNTKITTQVVDAANVTFTSQQNILAQTVAGALDELKLDEKNFVTKSGGVLTGNLDAGGQNITNLRAPQNGSDAATRSFVESQITSNSTALENVFVKRDGGQLLSNLDANNKLITSLQDPAANDHAANKQYVDNQVSDAKNDAANTYLPKNNGVLGTDLNANNKKITNLATPTADTDAANVGYVKSGFVALTGAQNIAGEKTFDDQAHFVQGLDMMNSKITDLEAGTADGDAINMKQLKDLLQTIQGQLTGKLTYCGTYDAAQNEVAAVSTAGTAHGFNVGDPLPADGPTIANCFVIVTVAGTGKNPAPTQAMGVGDILLAQGGGGWLLIPIGSTRTASNVAVTAIQQLPGATNVQEALQQLATKPAGASTAAQVTFTPTGQIAANNVQAALAEVDRETVKLAGSQTITGGKTFGDRTYFAHAYNGESIALRCQSDVDVRSAIVWQLPTGQRRAAVGFTQAIAGAQNTMRFVIDPAGDAASPSRFQFTKPIEYNVYMAPTTDVQMAPKKYVDDQITAAGANYLTKVGGQLGGPLNANNQKITNLATPTDAGDAVSRSFAEGRYLGLTGNQTAQGSKTFTGPLTAGRLIAKAHAEGGLVLQSTNDMMSFISWKVRDTNTNRGWIGFVSTQSANQNIMQFHIHAAGATAQPSKFQFTRIMEYNSATLLPTEPQHIASKKYVDDAIAAGGGGGGPAGLQLVSISDVDITANFAGLTGKGTATISYRLLKDTAGLSFLSALFGMKLTLTAAWTPTVSNTPTELVAAAHIPGQDYYNGLPIPIDSTLGSNDYKTVAQIHLYRAVRGARGNAIQADAPIKLGRIVCTNDGGGAGTTKLAVVFTYNQPIPVPSGQGAFYVMRYEGLPTMPI